MKKLILTCNKYRSTMLIAYMLLAGLALGVAGDKTALACSLGPLDYIKTGETAAGVVNKFGGCGGEVIMRRLSSTVIPEGVVMCAKPSRDSEGKKVLIVNSYVVAVREGFNENESCSW